jgi:hypothetical protein
MSRQRSVFTLRQVLAVMFRMGLLPEGLMGFILKADAGSGSIPAWCR